MTRTTGTGRRGGGRATWTAGLVVALAAGVATAHGLHQVAAASGVPGPVAWLYPVITDGLALVAYAATARLHATGRRYAAWIVALAAGLSGLAQAVYLAGGITGHARAPAGLRFGVGYWPALAAAIAAHLLHLIGSSDDDQADAAQASVVDRPADRPASTSDMAFTGAASNRPSNQSNEPASNPAFSRPVQPRPTEPRTTPPVHPGEQPPLYNAPAAMNTDPPANGHQRPAERARTVAVAHRDRTGALPTVTELMHLADVARGTAGTALKALREQHPTLHLVNATSDQDTDQ